MSIRRTQGRDGRIYYFNSRGRRIPESRGARQYVRENFQQIQRENLSPREQRSYNASQRARGQFRFEGRFVQNPFGIFNRFLIAQGLPRDARNLDRFFSRSQIDRILDNTYTTNLTTFRNNVQNIFESYETSQGDLLDSYSELDYYTSRGYELIVTLEGIQYTGEEGLEALRDYEQYWQEYYLQERGNELDNVEFIHRMRTNPRNRTIEINLDETDIIPRGGTP